MIQNGSGCFEVSKSSRIAHSQWSLLTASNYSQYQVEHCVSTSVIKCKLASWALYTAARIWSIWGFQNRIRETQLSREELIQYFGDRHWHHQSTMSCVARTDRLSVRLADKYE